jgi:hypothetical protein
LRRLNLTDASLGLLLSAEVGSPHPVPSHPSGQSTPDHLPPAWSGFSFVVGRRPDARPNWSERKSVDLLGRRAPVHDLESEPNSTEDKLIVPFGPKL